MVWGVDVLSLYGAIFLFGVSRAAVYVNIPPLVYEFAPYPRRPTYIGLSSTLFGLCSVIATLLGGAVAQSLGYTPLFVASLVISIFAFVSYVVF
jgi:MFS family permease